MILNRMLRRARFGRRAAGCGKPRYQFAFVFAEGD